LGIVACSKGQLACTWAHRRQDMPVLDTLEYTIEDMPVCKLGKLECMSVCKMVDTFLDTLVGTLRPRIVLAQDRKLEILRPRGKHRSNNRLPNSQPCRLVRKIVEDNMKDIPGPCEPLRDVGFLNTRMTGSMKVKDMRVRNCCTLEVVDTVAGTVFALGTRISPKENSGIPQPNK